MSGWRNVNPCFQNSLIASHSHLFPAGENFKRSPK